jgi:hypothetical protein
MIYETIAMDYSGDENEIFEFGKLGFLNTVFVEEAVAAPAFGDAFAPAPCFGLLRRSQSKNWPRNCTRR